MISAILATLAFVVIVEGLLVSFLSKDIKKFFRDLVKKKNAEKIIRKIGLWEILIGFLLMVAAILLRNS